MTKITKNMNVGKQPENTPSGQVQGFKDDKGNSIMSPELQQKFGEKRDHTYLEEIRDKDGNVKAGFEVFDLNGDGKIDRYEMNYLKKNNLDYANNRELSVFLQNMDASGKADGVISKKEKMKIYKDEVANFDKEQQTALNSNQVKDSKGNNVVSDNIKSMFSKSEVSFEEIVDADGKVKAGFEVFDLNGDGKVDDIERKFYSGGGKVTSGDGKTVKIEDFLNTVKLLDKYATDEDLNRLEDNSVSDNDKKDLYQTLEGVYNMIDNISALPENQRQTYLDAINNVEFIANANPSVGGENYGNAITINNKGLNNVNERTVTLVHELTHFIINRNTKEAPMNQEVETYYAQTKFTRNLKNSPNYDKTKGEVYQNVDYMKAFDKKKKEHPEMSEKQLAIETFLDVYYDWYKQSGYKAKTPDEMRNASYYMLDKQ